MQKYNLVVRASCSLSVSSEQDARTTKLYFCKIGMLPNILAFTRIYVFINSYYRIFGTCLS
ncbi:MAG: hypothetical protein AAF630_19120, partial [Cyanobacteria bacterium P01_C01_bin.38]